MKDPLARYLTADKRGGRQTKQGRSVVATVKAAFRIESRRNQLTLDHLDAAGLSKLPSHCHPQGGINRLTSRGVTNDPLVF